MQDCEHWGKQAAGEVRLKGRLILLLSNPGPSAANADQSVENHVSASTGWLSGER